MARSTARAKRHSAWWLASDDELPKEVWKRMLVLAEQNREMRLDNAMYMSVAANGNVDGSGSYGSETTQYRMLGLKMRKNLVTALVDTAASLIAANRTMPLYQTTAGDFSLALKAQQKSRTIHSQMWNLGAFDLGIDAFYDGAQVGTGATHCCIDPDTGLPKLVRVMPNSIFVDLAEGRNPRTLIWVHFLNRDYLAGIYPKLKDEIESAQGPTTDDYEEFWIRRAHGESDIVKVVEAWHLPSSSKSGDGMHVVTLNNCVIEKSEHERQRFPFAWYHYARRRAGFFGQGLVERALPAQIRHWQLQTVIDQCQNNGSNQVFLIEENSNVRAEDIDNFPGTPIYYQGTAPEAVVWSGTPQDLVAEQERIWQHLLDQEGLSPGMIGGELPQKGLNSARAVRAADDVSSRRQVIPTRAFEGYYLQVAQLIADANDDIAMDDPNYEVTSYTRAGRQAFLESSRWEDLAMEDGNVKLTVFSMSAQPTTPAAKMQAVQEYTEAGYMSKAQAISLLEFPDVDAWEQLETANQDLVEYQIEQLRKGKPELPIPNQDLQLAKKTANDALLVAYRTKAPEDVLRMFNDYIAYAQKLMDDAAAELAQQQAAQAAMMTSPPTGDEQATANDQGAPPQAQQQGMAA